jgi:protein gp37
MAEHTKIQWCDHTFNSWIGCAKVNEGCQPCYAAAWNDRFHFAEWGPRGKRYRTSKAKWREPLAWNRKAQQADVRRKVFCASLADVFEDHPQLPPWRADLFDLIDRCPNLYWLILTKRPENILSMWPGDYREHVWLGTSIANQRNADEFIDRLLPCRDLVPFLFLSVEPQIAYVDLEPWLSPKPLLDWVIVGGESGPNARPFQIKWAADIIDQCGQANVAVFVKQLGSNAYDGKRRLQLVDSHGGDIHEWPRSLRVRQCPESFVYS